MRLPHIGMVRPVCVMQTFATFISVGNYSDTSVAGVIVKVSSEPRQVKPRSFWYVYWDLQMTLDQVLFNCRLSFRAAARK